jgi:hypothetical protein
MLPPWERIIALNLGRYGGDVEALIIRFQVISLLVSLAALAILIWSYIILNGFDPETRQQAKNIRILRNVFGRIQIGFGFSALLFVSSCVGGRLYETREEAVEANKAQVVRGSYAAIEACNAALKPELASADPMERSVAASLYGSDFGSKAQEVSPGKFSVKIVRGMESERSCPIQLDGACTVSDGIATVTEPLKQNGYIAC